MTRQALTNPFLSRALQGPGLQQGLHIKCSLSLYSSAATSLPLTFVQPALGFPPVLPVQPHCSLPALLPLKLGVV